MGKYILRRLLLMIPTVIGVTMVVFFCMALRPGGVAAAMNLEGNMRPQEREALRKYLNQRYGLDKPLIVQYGRWLNQVSPLGFQYDAEGKRAGFGFKPPDLGRSRLRDRPVLGLIAETLPVTLLLNLITIPLVYGIAISAGIYAARHRGKWFDLSSGVLFIALWSMPVMWVGVMLLGFFASEKYIRWFPTGGLHNTMAEQMAFLPAWGAGGFERGWLLDAAWHLVLPIFCMAYGGFAFLSKLMRASILDNISADYARTARAKGVAEHAVLLRHVFRNSLIPLITVGAGILPGLLGGSVIVERIFSINGMGNLVIEAIDHGDNELVLSITFVVAIIGTISLLLADLSYVIADPRVSYE